MSTAADFAWTLFGLCFAIGVSALVALWLNERNR